MLADPENTIHTPHAAELVKDQLRRVVAFYAELDQEIRSRNYSCAGCGECCHFETVDHILYASCLERQLLAATAPPPHPDGAPEPRQAGTRCPLQQNTACHAREARALGCRLHFCNQVNTVEMEEFSASWHDKLKALHDHLGIAWEYQPLLPLPFQQNKKSVLHKD